MARRSILLFVALLAACEPDPDSVVVLYGQLQNEARAAVPNAPLQLWRFEQAGCVSLSLPPDARTFSHFKDVTTDEQRNLAFALTIGQVSPRFRENPMDGPYCFRIVSPASASAGESFLQLEHDQQDMQLPGMVRWSSGPSVVGQIDGGVVLAPVTAPFIPGQDSTRNDGFDAGFGLPPPRIDRWTIRSAGALVWAEPISDALRVDGFLLEDFADPQGGQEAIAYNAGTESSNGPTLQPPFSFSAAVGSESVALASAARVPQSRGVGCDWGFGAADAGACPFTDGLLSWQMLPDDAQGSPPLALTLHWSNPSRRTPRSCAG